MLSFIEIITSHAFDLFMCIRKFRMRVSMFYFESSVLCNQPILSSSLSVTSLSHTGLESSQQSLPVMIDLVNMFIELSFSCLCQTF